MRISYSFHGQLNVFDRVVAEVSIGRRPPGATSGPDLDLGPDFTVSRSHARLWQDADRRYWIEDTGSTHGTLLNGREIKGGGACEIKSGDRIQIGETVLQIDFASTPSAIRPAVQMLSVVELGGEVASELAVSQAQSGALLQEASADIMSRLGLLFDLILQCGNAKQLDEVLQQMVNRLVEMIPGATRGALLLHGRESDTMLLKAFSSAQGPVVSETLARRAMQNGTGFIWKSAGSGNDGGSLARYQVECAMYAPLMWQGTPLGVMCVDNPIESEVFTSNDLRLLMTASHFLGLALANQQLQEELRRESSIKAKLLRQFSPQIAEQLLAHGTTQLSGERSEVTILCLDIRGFTVLTKDMKPVDVVELLNDYFNRLTPIILAHNGTIDKYIGDAILAVYGSPKADPDQHLNALRAALDMQTEMEKSNRARAAKGKATCQIGIGVHCGEVLHGNIGAVDQVSYTIIGEAVNRATRYGDCAAGGTILLSPQVYQWVWKQVEVEPATIETKHEGSLPAFRLVSIKES